MADLRLPLDVSEYDQFMMFRISKSYKYKREDFDKKLVYCTVTLPLPQNLSTSWQTTWNGQSLGPVGAAAASKAPELIGAVQQAAQGDRDGAINRLKSVLGNEGLSLDSESLKEVAGNLALYYGSELTASAGGLLASSAGPVGAILGAGLGQAVQGITIGAGIARNPYLAAAFEGVNFKTHNFSWNIVPKNEKESDILRSIISAFRNAMLPGVNKLKHFYDYPKQFGITLSDNKYLFDIKTSVLTSFDVNFHGKGAQYHYPTNAPVEVTLNASFLETVVRVSNDENYGIAKALGGGYIKSPEELEFSIRPAEPTLSFSSDTGPN
jgi:hypothetical protein